MCKYDMFYNFCFSGNFPLNIYISLSFWFRMFNRINWSNTTKKISSYHPSIGYHFVYEKNKNKKSFRKKNKDKSCCCSVILLGDNIMYHIEKKLHAHHWLFIIFIFFKNFPNLKYIYSAFFSVLFCFLNEIPITKSFNDFFLCFGSIDIWWWWSFFLYLAIYVSCLVFVVWNFLSMLFYTHTHHSHL